MSQNLQNQFSLNVEIGGKIDLWVQIFLLIVVAVYVIFAFLVNKQVGILNDTISTPRARWLRNFARIHLITAVVVLAVLILVLIF